MYGAWSSTTRVRTRPIHSAQSAKTSASAPSMSHLSRSIGPVTPACASTSTIVSASIWSALPGVLDGAGASWILNAQAGLLRSSETLRRVPATQAWISLVSGPPAASALRRQIAMLALSGSTATMVASGKSMRQ